MSTRINRNGVKSGYATSQSIPLADPSFYNHIEEGIKPLVLAFRSRGYFTLSSCVGHSLHDYSEVVIAIPAGIEALLIPLRLKGLLRFCDITTRDPSSYMEMSEMMQEGYEDIPIHRLQGKLDTRKKMSQEEAVQSLNLLFDRNYDDYTLVFIRVVPTIKELILPLAWVARYVLGSFLIAKAARIISKRLEVFNG